jgi:glutamate--cysteine ligase catalytic subunit
MKDTDEYILQFEYGKWMIEVVPKTPIKVTSIIDFEESIKQMYKFMEEKIGSNKILSLAAFPILGSGRSYYQKIGESQNELSDSEGLTSDSEEEEVQCLDINKTNIYSESSYTHDIIINSHPRFGNLTRNIRQRRGKKVEIKIPIYEDVNTGFNSDEPFPGYIHMDSMAFGMGSCCLQVTIGSKTLQHAAYLYDQFIPFTPLLLALSASTPILKGKLARTDSRWSVISQAVDDRTEEELNKNSERFIHKSRYSPVYSYISEHPFVQDYHNDYPKFPINQDYFNTLIENGVDERLATHFCNLLVRDPLVIFDKKIHIDDESDKSHFENFNSTNWNSLRFKPPRLEDNDACFKVEVRPCDLQLTPIENLSMINLIMCISRVIQEYDCNFIIPISMVDENFRRAEKINAVTQEKFYWRVDGIHSIIKKKENATLTNITPKTFDQDEKMIKELTLNEIINGSIEHNYPGLLRLLIEFLEDDMNENRKAEKERIIKSLKMISLKAKGSLWTDAKYIRNFVINHPKYLNDSVVTEEINFDLIKHLLGIQNGLVTPKELFGNIYK